MVVNKRYAQHLGEVMIRKSPQDNSYQRFTDLRATFDSSEPFYIDHSYARNDQNED